MRSLIIIILTFIILSSCVTEPDNTIEDFSFKICVTDTAGIPVEGIDVYLINKLSDPIIENHFEESRAQTNIMFSLIEMCFVDLSIHDIEENNVRNLINDELVSGGWSAIWDGKDNLETEVVSGVYYCNMDVYNNDSLSYNGNIMMYLLSFGSEHRNGVTNFEGIFESTDKKPFMNLYCLDSLNIVNEMGEILGYEVFSDTTIICLKKQDADQLYQFEYVVVEDKRNENNFIWNPDTIRVENKNCVWDTCSRLKRANTFFPPYSTELRGNYPNPFY